MNLKPFNCLSATCKGTNNARQVQHLAWEMVEKEGTPLRISTQPCVYCGSKDHLNPLTIIHLLVSDAKGPIPGTAADTAWNFACEAARNSPRQPKHFTVSRHAVTCNDCLQVPVQTQESLDE